MIFTKSFKKFFVFLFLLLSTLAQGSPSNHRPTIWAFYDFDGVLAYQTPTLSPRQVEFLKRKHTVVEYKSKHGSEPYVIAHGAPEVLGAQARIPQVKVGIFTSSPSERIHAILSQVKLPRAIPKKDGTLAHTLDEIVTVFSKEDLNPKEVDLESGDKVSINKDLKNLVSKVPDLDLDWAILNDDWAEFIPESARKNWVLVTPGQPFFEYNLYSPKNLFNVVLLPPSVPSIESPTWNLNLEKARERNKLVRTAGIFVEALRIANTSGGKKTLTDGIQETQGPYESYRYEHTNSSKIFQLGLNLVRTYAPNFQLAEKKFCHLLLSPAPRKQSVEMPAQVVQSLVNPDPVAAE